MDEVSNFSPEMAVPTTVKMPEPMTAPMPSDVRETGPRVFLRLVSGFSDSLMSLSMDLQQRTWGGRVRLLYAGIEGSVPGMRPAPREKFSGADFLRAVRLSALRSDVSSIAFVFAIR